MANMQIQSEKFFDRDWDKGLPKISEIKRHKQVYSESDWGIYFLFSGERLMYVGCSINCFIRFADHKKNGKEFDSYFVIDTSDLSKFDMLELEAKYIFKYNPPLNKDSFMEYRKRVGWIRDELSK